MVGLKDGGAVVGVLDFGFVSVCIWFCLLWITMVVPFIDHITSSRQVDMKEEAIGRIISGFDDLFSYWFFVSPSIMKSICYAYPLISKGISLLLSRL